MSLVFTVKQLAELRKAGLMPYPTARQKLEARQNNSELLRRMTKPTRAERKAGERLGKWLTTTKDTNQLQGSRNE